MELIINILINIPISMVSTDIRNSSRINILEGGILRWEFLVTVEIAVQ